MDEPFPNLKSSHYVVGLMILIGITYSLSLDNAFIYDDIPLITQRPPSASIFGAFEVFTKPHWHNLPYYRPVAGLSMALQKTWHGNEPAMFHFFNLVVLMASSVVAFALLRLPTFGLSRLMACLAAALFAVHPVASSCVYPICSGRETLLPGLFILLAVYGWLRGERMGYGIALVGLTLGLLSKEQAVIIPVLFIMADLLKLTGFKTPAWQRYLPVAALVIAYFLIRRQIFAGLPHAETEFAIFKQPLGPLLTLAYMLQTWFAPFLALRYEPGPKIWPSLPHAVLAIVLIGITIKLFFRSRDAWRQMLFFVLFAGAAVAPTANIIAQEAHFAERYIWLAWLMVPACAFIALQTISRPALIFSGLAILLLAGISLSRDRYFQDYPSYLQQWIASDPAASQPYLSMGDMLREQNQLAAAEPYYRQAYELNPENVVTLNNFGTFYQVMGEYDKALPLLSALMETRSDDFETCHNLATTYAGLGQTNEAIQLYLDTLERGSNHVPSLYNLALLMSQAGRVPDAIRYYQRSIALDPNYKQSYYSLGHVYARQNNLPKAEAMFMRLVQLDPMHAEGYHALAIVFIRQGKRDLAIQYCREAIRLNPGFTEARRNLELMLK